MMLDKEYLEKWEAGVIKITVPVLGIYQQELLDLIRQAKSSYKLQESLKTAIRWLRRLEQEYPKCLNEDAITKHLESSLEDE